jgi:hypothetical protein
MNRHRWVNAGQGRPLFPPVIPPSIPPGAVDATATARFRKPEKHRDRGGVKLREPILEARPVISLVAEPVRVASAGIFREGDRA